jgi:hypothetical protein
MLACLPAAAFSSKPPPALLPLLTPILRQRVHMLTAGPSSDSWLLLLNWNRELAAKLPPLVEQMNLEPHPVSGEIELSDIGRVRYRRLDPETLQARFEVGEFGLLPIYLWCTGGDQNEETGWKLTELRSLEDKVDDSQWFDSMNETETNSREKAGLTEPPAVVVNGVGTSPNGGRGENGGDQDEDDDDAYWAQYTNTPGPGRTPARPSPAPASAGTRAPVQPASSSELEYFSRYLSEVQPAMDPYDPAEDIAALEESTLNHHDREFAASETSNPMPLSAEHGRPPPHGEHHDTATVDIAVLLADTPINTRPLSSSSVESVGRLERQAQNQSQVEVGIKQHISTDIKSLYRLARSAGIERGEFERIVKTELEVLPMLELE